MGSNYLTFTIQERKKNLTNFISIFIETKILSKLRFFILLFMCFKLKLQNPSEKLFLNRNKRLDIEVSDSN